jgi:epoxyqueuosine reductase
MPYYPEPPATLRDLFATEGLHLLGVSTVDANSQAQVRYDQWLNRGRHGQMGYLERHAPLKYHPDAILPGCRSILVVGLNYFQERPADPTTPAGRVAIYAWGRDYHTTLLQKLKHVQARLRETYPNDRFRAFTDTAPLDERTYAEQAGIGFRAKNTLVIHGDYGSWFFIGEILSTYTFPPSPVPEQPHGACPSACQRCIKACPTGALLGPHEIDATKCISYLTIEHRGIIPEPLREKMGDWLFGCDRCQTFCPFNLKAQPTEVPDFQQHRTGPYLDLGELLSIPNEEAFRIRFAGSPILRAGWVCMIRNGSIVAANVGATSLLPRLKELAQNPDPIIAEHATWAVKRLK